MSHFKALRFLEEQTRALKGFKGLLSHGYRRREQEERGGRASGLEKRWRDRKEGSAQALETQELPVSRA